MSSVAPRRLWDMLTPKVTEITRAGHAWMHPAAPRTTVETRPPGPPAPPARH
jgi:hypothetical protein